MRVCVCAFTFLGIYSFGNVCALFRLGTLGYCVCVSVCARVFPLLQFTLLCDFCVRENVVRIKLREKGDASRSEWKKRVQLKTTESRRAECEMSSRILSYT